MILTKPVQDSTLRRVICIIDTIYLINIRGLWAILSSVAR